MKPGIHPTWYPDAVVTCACGNTWTTGSTKKEIHTDVCHKCHPFFTGEQRIVDTAGQVERFMKRVNAKEQIAATQPALADKKAKREKRREHKAGTTVSLKPTIEAPSELPLAVVEEKPAATETPAPTPVVEEPKAKVAEPKVAEPVAQVDEPAPVARLDLVEEAKPVEEPAPIAKVEEPAPVASIEEAAPVAQVEETAPVAVVEETTPTITTQESTPMAEATPPTAEEPQAASEETEKDKPHPRASTRKPTVKKTTSPKPRTPRAKKEEK